MPPAAGVADAWLSLLRLQRSIGNAPIRRLLSRGNTSLYTTFEHFLSPCTPRADTQAHVLIGWQLGAHTHSHVDTRPALSAAAWPLEFFIQWVTVIVVRGSGVAYALQNPISSSQGKGTQRQDALPIHAERNDGVHPVDTAMSMLWPQGFRTKGLRCSSMPGTS